MISRIMRQAGAELAAGMEGAEMVGREAARLEQRHGQRVADRQLQQRRGGRRQPVRTGFRRLAAATARRPPARASADVSPAVMAISGMAKRRE